MRQQYRQYVKGLFCTGPIAVFCAVFGVATVPLLVAADRINLPRGKVRFFVREMQRSPLWSPIVIAAIVSLCVLLYKPVKHFLEREIPSPVCCRRGMGWYIFSLLATTLVLHFLHIDPLVWRYALLMLAMVAPSLLIDLFRCRRAE